MVFEQCFAQLNTATGTAGKCVREAGHTGEHSLACVSCALDAKSGRPCVQHRTLEMLANIYIAVDESRRRFAPPVAADVQAAIKPDVPCSACGGCGNVPSYNEERDLHACRRCAGSGKEPSERTMDFWQAQASNWEQAAQVLEADRDKKRARASRFEAALREILRLSWIDGEIYKIAAEALRAEVGR